MYIDEWQAVNRRTGEEIPMSEFDQRRSRNQGRYQLAHIRYLLSYFEIIETPSVTLLLYLLKTKNGRNQVIATQRKIAEDTEISLITVKKVMKKLLAKDAIKRISNGVYMLNPLILSYGAGSLAGNKRVWEELANV